MDDHLRLVWIFLMKSKAKTQSHLMSFVAFVERQVDTKVKMIRSDNGSEFIMKQFYDESSIIHQSSCVETPQQNEIVERKHNIYLMSLDLYYFNLICLLSFGPMLLFIMLLL